MLDKILQKIIAIDLKVNELLKITSPTNVGKTISEKEVEILKCLPLSEEIEILNFESDITKTGLIDSLVS